MRKISQKIQYIVLILPKYTAGLCGICRKFGSVIDIAANLSDFLCNVTIKTADFKGKFVNVSESI